MKRQPPRSKRTDTLVPYTTLFLTGGTLAVSRQEATSNYQCIRDQKNWPEAAKATTKASADSGQNTAGVATQQQKVVWSGDITAGTSGVHKFRLYASSYFKLYADGKLVLDRWRQNWNPWFHKIGRANVCTPVTNAHLVCRLLFQKQ